MPWAKVQRWHGVVAVVCEDESGVQRFEGRTKWRDGQAYQPRGAARWWAELRSGSRRPFPPAAALDEDEELEDEDEELERLRLENAELRGTVAELRATVAQLVRQEPTLDQAFGLLERMHTTVAKVHSEAQTQAAGQFRGVLEAYNGALSALAGRVETLEDKAADLAERIGAPALPSPAELEESEQRKKLDDLAATVAAAALEAAQGGQNAAPQK